MTEIIQLTETSRLRIEQDTDAECPRGDWHMLTGFVKIRNLGDSRLSDVPAVHDDPTGNIAAAMDHLERGDDRSSGDVAERVARWARIFHDLHLEWDDEHGGFWFVALDGPDLFAENWPDLVPGSPEHLAQQAKVIEQEQEVYRQWAEGEVYGVIFERQKTWAEVTPGGIIVGDSTIETWEEVESIWGNYLDDSYTPADVASESFDLTEEEHAAIVPMLTTAADS